MPLLKCPRCILSDVPKLPITLGKYGIQIISSIVLEVINEIEVSKNKRTTDKCVFHDME